MLFLTSGIGKLGAIKVTQKYMEAYGVPAYLVFPVAALEIGSGSMLIMGVHLRWLGQVLAAWCMLTAMIFHTGFADQNEKINLLKSMAMAGGFLMLSVTTPPEKGDPEWQPTAGKRGRGVEEDQVQYHKLQRPLQQGKRSYCFACRSSQLP